MSLNIFEYIYSVRVDLNGYNKLLKNKRLEAEGLSNTKFLNQCLADGHYSPVLERLWAERDLSKRVTWLRAHEGELHTILLYEQALAETEYNPTAENIRKVVLPLLAAANFRLRQDFAATRIDTEYPKTTEENLINELETSIAELKEKIPTREKLLSDLLTLLNNTLRHSLSNLNTSIKQQKDLLKKFMTQPFKEAFVSFFQQLILQFDSLDEQKIMRLVRESPILANFLAAKAQSPEQLKEINRIWFDNLIGTVIKDDLTINLEEIDKRIQQSTKKMIQWIRNSEKQKQETETALSERIQDCAYPYQMYSDDLHLLKEQENKLKELKTNVFIDFLSQRMEKIATRRLSPIFEEASISCSSLLEFKEHCITTPQELAEFEKAIREKIISVAEQSLQIPLPSPEWIIPLTSLPHSPFLSLSIPLSEERSNPRFDYAHTQLGIFYACKTVEHLGVD